MHVHALSCSCYVFVITSTYLRVFIYICFHASIQRNTRLWMANSLICQHYYVRPHPPPYPTPNHHIRRVNSVRKAWVFCLRMKVNKHVCIYIYIYIYTSLYIIMHYDELSYIIFYYLLLSYIILYYPVESYEILWNSMKFKAILWDPMESHGAQMYTWWGYVTL